MKPALKPIFYRLNGSPCRSGYQDVSSCGPGMAVYSDPDGLVAVPGAVVTPADSCPNEVFLAPAMPTDVTAQDCVGGDIVVPVNSTVLTVPHPTAVQLVRLCSQNPAADREVSMWCSPTTGAQVTVVSYWPEDSAPGTPPTVEAYNVDGSVYTGAIGALVKCAGVGVELVSDPVCVNGLQYVRSTFFDAATRTVAGVVWQDALGAVVAVPQGVPVEGLCSARETVQVDFVKVSPGATLTGAQLLAQVGGTRLRAVNLLVVSGAATVAGRTTFTTFNTNETFTWAALGADQEDALSTLFSVTANGGTTRLIVSYIL